MTKMVVLLGNPGKQYEKTRHNVAWMIEPHLSFEIIWQKKFKGMFASHTQNGTTLYFLKPLTYMNKSGESVASASAFFKITIPEILVVHDEVELQLGLADIKYGGGLAGHKGLKSISSSTGSQDFVRFRIGIGRPNRGDVSDHVLGTFSPEEIDVVQVMMKNAALAVDRFIRDTEKTLNTASSLEKRTGINLLEI